MKYFLQTASTLIFSLAFFFSVYTQAQNIGPDEKQSIEILKREGISEADIQAWLLTRKQMDLNTLKSGTPSVNSSGLCSDLGVENGWSTWQAATGDYASSGVITWNATGLTPSAPRFNLTSGTGVDLCTPSGGGPAIGVVAPGFGSSSIQLGQRLTGGSSGGCNLGCTERLTFDLQVTAGNTNFIYTYAIILDNPSGHAANNQPFAEIYILDSGGDTIPCSYNKYIGDINGGIPVGMYGGGCTSPSGAQIAYLPWTTNGVNLLSYLGQTVKVVLTNADCAQGAHFCHSYWDFLCGSIPLNSGCNGSQTTICGPPSTGAPYAYQWYLNGNIMPGSTNQCLQITPNSGNTYTVNVMPQSGCDYQESYVAYSGSLQSLFTYTPNSNTISFTDLSTGAVSHNWGFGDGNTSNQQNPVHTYSSPGSYTACLIVSDGTCSDTVCKVITIAAVGVNEYDAFSSFSVFPIPASKNIILDFSGNDPGKAKVYVTNMMGEEIFETSISATGRQVLDVSEFPEGIYFVRVKNSSGSVTKKIVISK